ncbi:pectate lyase-like adhesive domain-containing protein [Viridibacillus arvi]|uniref:pectate lyase-like adhesive domain-containing protein n=1 Tax=Viridibacillus arvi TaxID=263475 RepID=UPI003D087E7A
MGNRNLKFVKPIASIILGAAVMTTAIGGTPNNVEAASNYKVSNGKLISKTTGKSVKGTKTYKGKVYKNGKLLNGLKSGVYYNKGKKASGTYKGKYYSKGKVYSGVKSGVYYKSGAKATGTYKNKYYSKGKVYTGLKSGIYYKNGAKGTGTHKGKYYETGKVLSGLQSKSGDLYIDGVLNTGLTLFEGKLYNGAKVNEGVINFDGKWYSGSAIATGTIKTPDGQTIVVENGVPTTPPGNNNGGGSTTPPVNPAPSALDKAKENARALKSEDYTSDSYAALTKALTLAERTAEEKEVKIKAIEDAIKGLVSIKAEVSNQDQLEKALTNPVIQRIIFKNDIEITKQIITTKSIDGDKHTLTLDEEFKLNSDSNNKSILTVLATNDVVISNLTVDAGKANTNKWDGLYVLQVYKSTGVKLNNLKLINGDAGLLVNGSEVIVNGITTEKNQVGGIEVSKGEGLKDSSLTIQGSSSHDDEEGTPAIWLVDKQGTINAPSYSKVTGGAAKKQQYYNLTKEKYVGDQGELTEALSDNSITDIIFTKNIETNEQIITTKSINGNGHSLIALNDMKYTDPNKSVLTILEAKGITISNLKIDAGKPKSQDWASLYALQVYNSVDIELNNLTLENGNAGLLINGSKVKVNEITTKDNGFGGIEVSKGVGLLESSSLTIEGTSIHDDVAETPAIWVEQDQNNVLVANSYKAVDGGGGKNQQYYNLKTNED